MERCHLCGETLPRHDESCRVHQDMMLFDRVYRRLRSESRNRLLMEKLAHHLARHGRLDAEEAA